MLNFLTVLLVLLASVGWYSLLVIKSSGTPTKVVVILMGVIYSYLCVQLLLDHQRELISMHASSLKGK